MCSARMPRDMMNRSMLLAMGRVVDFLAGTKPVDWGDVLHETPGEALRPSDEAYRKLAIIQEVAAVRVFILRTFRQRFAGRAFRWKKWTQDNEWDAVLYTGAGETFPVLQFRHCHGGDDHLGLWFRIKCDYGIDNNMLHDNPGHHLVSFDEDDDGDFWRGTVYFNGGVPSRHTDRDVHNREDAFKWLRWFLVGNLAEGLVDYDASSSSECPSFTASSPRSP